MNILKKTDQSEPIIFTCQCEWVYVINKNYVVGPFYNNPSTMLDKAVSSGRVITIEDFAEQYADCEYCLRRLPEAGGHVRTRTAR